MAMEMEGNFMTLRWNRWALPLILIYFLIPNFSHAQVGISNTVPSGMSVCGSADTFSVTISNNSVNDTFKNGELTVRMPDGMRYTKSSVSGTNVSEKNVGKLHRPIFNIPDINPGNSLKVEFTAAAGCDIVSWLNSGNIPDNTNRFDYSGGADSATSSQYLLAQPSLNFQSFGNRIKRGVVGDTILRQISISNPSSGSLENFELYIINKGGVYIDSFNKGTITRATDTVKITFSGADFKTIGDNDEFFEKNEQIDLVEYSTIKSCNNLKNTYIARWGCFGKACTKKTTTSNVIIIPKSPNLIPSHSGTQSSCYGSSSANAQSVSLRNNGSGPANNVKLNVYASRWPNGGLYVDQYTRFDTSSVTLLINGKSANFSFDSVFDNSSFSCFSTNDPKAGFIINIPLIKAGDTAVLQFNTYTCCMETNFYYNGWVYEATYNNQCGSGNNSTGRRWGLYRDYSGIASQSVADDDIRIGANTKVFINNSYMHLPVWDSGAYILQEWTLPKGLQPDTSILEMITSNGSNTWKPDSMTMTGSIPGGYTVKAWFDLPSPAGDFLQSPIFAIGIEPYRLRNSVSCGSTVNIDLKTSFKPDTSCTCLVELADDDFDLDVTCVNSGNLGLDNTSFEIERISFGLPDTNDNGVADSNAVFNMADVKEDRAMFGDTLESVFKGKVIAYGSNPSFDHGRGTIRFSEDRFDAVQADIEIYDANRRSSYTCTDLSYTKTGSSFLYEISPDTLRNNGCTSLPSSFTYANSDSVIITAKHEVTSNIGNDMRFIPVMADFFLSDSAAPVLATNKYQKNRQQSDFSLIGYYFTSWGAGRYSSRGCRDINVSENFYLSVGPCCGNYAGGNIFPYEYRNWAHLVKARAIIPANYKYKSTIFRYWRTAGTGGRNYTQITNLEPANRNSDTLDYKIDTLFQSGGGSLIPSDDGYFGSLIITIEGECDVQPNVAQTIQWDFTHLTDSILGGDSASTSRTHDDITYSPPNFTTIPSLQKVTTAGDSAHWEVNFNNTEANADATYSWVAFENTGNSISVKGVKLDGNSSFVNVSNGIYQLGEIKGGSFQKINIFSGFSGCTEDSIKLFFGWDCEGYPDSFGAYTCPFLDSVWLYASPLEGKVEISTNSPTNPIGLCDTLIYRPVLTNVQQGNAYDTYFDIQLPDGMEFIPSEASVKYPLSSSYSSIADPDSLGNGLYRWYLDSVSNLIEQNSLISVQDTSKNKIKFEFKLTTNCNFTSGSNVSFFTRAFNKCGNEVSFQGIPSPVIDIIGAVAAYNSTIKIYGDNSFKACEADQSFTLSMLNDGSDTTQNNDNLYLEIPNGLYLDTSSFANAKNLASTSPKSIDSLNNAVRYTWQVLSGVSSGDSASVDFKINAEDSLSCRSLELNSYSTTETNVRCVADNSNCNISIKNGSLKKIIPVEKPTIILSDTGSYAKRRPGDSALSVHLNISVKNTGSRLLASRNSLIEFYEDRDDNGLIGSADTLLKLDSFKVMLDSGDVYIYRKTFDFPASASCRLIAKMNESADSNCACSESMVQLPQLPLKLGITDVAFCSGDTVAIGDTSITSIDYNWNTSAGLDDSSTYKSELSLLNTDHNSLKTVEYILELDRKACLSYDTLTAEVRPYPLINAGNDTSICNYDSIRLGSSQTIQGIGSPFSKKWSYPTNSNFSGDERPWVEPRMQTTYTLEVSNTYGCQSIDSVKLSVDPLPNVNAGIDDSICVGDTTAIGGTPPASGTGGYVYRWMNATNIIDSSNGNTKVFPVNSRDFVFKVTDQNSCENFDTTRIIVHDLPTVDAGSDTTVCRNETISLGGNPSASGGKTPYAYHWGGISSNSANLNISLTATDTFTLTVTDGNNCKDSDELIATAWALPKAEAGVNDTVCPGDSIQLGGAPSASGGNSPYSYSWSVINDNTSNPWLKPDSSANYQLIVSDKNSCSDTDEVEIILAPQPTVDAGNIDSLCPGDTINIAGTATHAASYNWTPGKLVTDSSKISSRAFPQSSQYFKLQITSPNTCTAEDSVLLYVRDSSRFSPVSLNCLKNIGDTALSLKWNSISADLRFKAYVLNLRDSSGNILKTKNINTSSVDSFEFNYVNLRDSVYSAGIQVLNTCGKLSSESDLKYSLKLLLKRIDQNSIELKWNKPYKNYTGNYDILSDSGQQYLYARTTDTSILIKECNSELSFILQATNACGLQSAESRKIKFNDTNPPADISVKGVSVISNNTLNVFTNGSDSADILEYYLLQGTAADNLSIIDTLSALNDTLKITVSNTRKSQYCFALMAVDTCGNISDTSLVKCSAELQASAANLSINLEWESFTNTAIDSLWVQRWNGTGFIDHKLLAINDSNFIDSGLACNISQSYRLRAVSDTLNLFSDSTRAVPFDTLKPLSPQVKFASALNNTSLELEWTASSADVKDYEVQLKTRNTAWRYISSTQNLGDTLTGLYLADSQYCVRVIAIDTCASNRSDASAEHCLIELSGTEANLQNNLNWHAYSGKTVEKYFIYERNASSYSLIDSVSSSDTTYTHKSLNCSEPYHYKIMARLPNGFESFSDSLELTPFDTVKPSKPNLLSISRESGKVGRLRWFRNSEPDVQSYIIERKSGISGWQAIDTIAQSSLDTLQYFDSSLALTAQNYCYRIYAFDSCSNLKSAMAEEHCFPILSGVEKNYANQINWIKYSGDFSDSVQLQSLENGKWSTIFTSTSDTTYLHKKLACNRAVSYRLALFFAADSKRVLSDTIQKTPFDTIRPPRPDLKYVSVIGDTAFEIAWWKSRAEDVKEYWIEQLDNGSWQTVDTVFNDTSSLISATKIKSSECFRIIAVDSCVRNKSLPSDIDCSVFLQSSIDSCQQKIKLDWNHYSYWPNKSSSLRLERKTDTGNYKTVALLLWNDSSFVDTQVQVGPVYRYRLLRSSDTATYQVYSTSKADSLYNPGTAEILSASVRSTDSSNGEIELKWNKNNSTYLNSYRIEYSTNGQAWKTLTDSIPLSQDTFIHKGINTASHDLAYRIKLRDQCGNLYQPGEVHEAIDLEINIGQLRHELIWTAYEGDSVLTYEIQRLGNSGFVAIDSTRDTSNTQFPAPCNFNVVYRIKSLLANGSFAYSDTIGRIAIDTIPPDAATWYNISVKSNYGVELKFIKADSADIYAYDVQRSTADSFYSSANLISSVFGDTVTYLDSGIVDENPVCYYLITLDSCLNVMATDTVCTSELSGTAGNLRNELEWSKLNFYTIDSQYIQMQNGAVWDTLAVLDPIDSAYTHIPLKCNIPRTYRLLSKGINGLESISDTIRITPFDTIRPDSPDLLQASVEQSGEVKLLFDTVNADDVELYEVFRSTNGGKYVSAGTVKQLNSGIQEFTDNNLQTRTNTYCYYVQAIDSCSANRSIASDTHCVVKPSVSAGNKEADISFTAYAGFNQTDYVIERFINGNFTALDTICGLSYTDADSLACNITYTYRIKALEVNGNFESYSDTVQVTPYDTLKPRQPVINYFSVISNSSAKLAWQASSGDVKDYRIEIKTNQTRWRFAGLSTTLSDTLNGYSFSDSNYCTRVTAIDTCARNESKPSAEHCQLELEGYAGNLENFLNWNNYKGSGVQAYFVYEEINGSFVQIDSLSGTDTSYVHDSLNCKETYAYKLKATFTNGYEVWSDSIRLTPFDTISPAEPVINYVSVLSDQSLYINWNASDDDVQKYIVQVKPEGGNWRNSSIRFGLDDTLRNLSLKDTTYCFTLIAEDTCEANRSFRGPEHCAVQLRGYAGNLENHLQWEAYSGTGVQKYYIYEYERKGQRLIDSVSATDTSYVHDTLLCATPYRYKIRARLSNGRLSWSDSLVLSPFDTIKPEKPQLRATSVVSNSIVELKFNASVSDDVEEYEIYASANKSAFSLIGNLKEDGSADYSFEHTGLNISNDRYCYYIRAIDSCGNNISHNTDTHCVIQLSGNPGNLLSELEWKTYAPLENLTYTVIRDSALELRSITDSAYTDSNELKCNLSYEYRIRTLNSYGDTIYSNTISVQPFDTIPPKAAKLNWASSGINGTAELNWDWDTAGDVKFFELYRAENGMNYQLLDTIIYDSQYVDQTAPALPNRPSYYLIAIDSCGALNRSLPSDTDRVAGIELSTGACFPEIRIAHEPYVKFESGINRQNVWRSNNNGGFIQIGQIQPGTKSFVDSNLAETDTACYRIETIANNGSTSFSDSLCMTPWIFPLSDSVQLSSVSVLKTNENAGIIELDWDAVPVTDSFARFYHIYHRETTSGNFNRIAHLPVGNTTRLRHSGLNTVDELHSYYVVAENLCAREGDRGRIHESINLEAMNGNLQAFLSWNDYRGLNVKTFNLFKAVNSGGFNSYAAMPGDSLSFTDNQLYCQNAYRYRLSAELENGEVVYSDSLNVMAMDTIAAEVAVIDGLSIAITDNTNGTINYRFTASPTQNVEYYQTEIRAKGGIWQTVDTVFNNQSVFNETIDDLNTEDNALEIRILAVDSCGNKSEYSGLHRSVHLNVDAKNAYNEIDFTAYTGIQDKEYQVFRRRAVSNWRPVYIPLDTNSLTAIDSFVQCDSTYYYRIGVREQGSGPWFFSNSDTANSYEINRPDTPIINRVTVQSSGEPGVNRLEWEAAKADDIEFYMLDRRTEGGNWTPLDTLAPQLFYEDVIANNNQVYYDYRIWSLDSCGNISANSSEMHRSIHLEVEPGNQQATLSWNKYRGWPVANYRIYKDGALLDSVQASDTQYVDTLVTCTKPYQYRIVALSTDRRTNSFSNLVEVEVEDRKAPPAPVLQAVSLIDTNNRIGVYLKMPPSFDSRSIKIEKWKSGVVGKNLIEEVSSEQTEAFDSLDERKSTCFTLVATDSCGNVSIESNEHCLMILRGESERDLHKLHWNAYNGWNEEPRYYEVYRSHDGEQFEYIGRSNDTTFTDNDLDTEVRDFCYRIKAVTQAGHEQNSWSTMLCLKQKPLVYIPNAFTPTVTEGLNDGFGPEGAYIKKFEMKIFNRWGTLVFETTESEFWNGEFGGDMAPMGSYSYVITVESFEGDKEIFNGSLMLVR